MGHTLQCVRTALLGPHAPADAGAAGPVPQPLEVVTREPERAAHRRSRRQVEDLAGGDPPVGEAQQPGQGVQQGVGLPERAVGQPHPQPVAGVTGTGLPERRPHQRRVGLDVGTHDEHIARLEGRVLDEQVQQGLAQHLHLTGRAVAGVHLDGAVGLGRGDRDAVIA